MNIVELRSFTKDKKRLEKEPKFSFEILEKQISLFKQNPNYPSLEFKHITCKRNKNRHSIRVTLDYRILMDKISDDVYHFIRLVKHKEYDRLTKSSNC